ncbi:MAG: hypothetical protein H0T21_10610, partial [Gemmatimonadaceae bacterium]|nr:hypothetical protein [Gemmatimonadaceae bacterium]
DAAALADAYTELRTAEHRLQLVDLAPAHVLPTDAEALDRLAAAPPTAMAATKSLFYKLDMLSFLDGMSAGIVANADARATPEFRAGVERFMGRARE